MREERASAEERDHERGLTDRDAALVGEVEREEWNDKPAEAVDERAAPQEPIGGRESLREGGEEVFVLRHVVFIPP